MKRRLFAVLLVLAVSNVLCIGLGFQLGTGLPMTNLLSVPFVPKYESVSIPQDRAVKTVQEVKHVVAEATKDSSYEVGYNCIDYAWDSMRALHWDGQYASIVILVFEDSKGHALVLTAITEETLEWFFLDPRTGTEVHPAVGGFWGGKKIESIKIVVDRLVDLDEWLENPTLSELGATQE